MYAVVVICIGVKTWNTSHNMIEIGREKKIGTENKEWSAHERRREDQW